MDIQKDIQTYECRINYFRTRQKELKNDHFEKLIQFDDRNRIKNLSIATRVNYLTSLYDFLTHLGWVNLENVTYDMTQKYILTLYDRKLTISTIKGRCLTLKLFLKFIDKIEISKKIPLPKIPESKFNLLSLSDVVRMVECSRNVTDKCIICLLAETGIRAGEIRNIKLKDIVFDNYGAIIFVSGKTGSRNVRVVQSVQILVDHIRYHKHKNDTDSYLFYNTNQKNGCDPLSHAGLYRKLKRAGKRANIKADVNPHNFRHSRFTELSSKLTDRELKIVGGWKTTKMLDVYSHLSGHEIDRAVLEKVYKIRERQHEAVYV